MSLLNGIVLDKRPYKEVDQLVSVYTQELGKIRCIARGSKKSTSKNAAALEIGSHIQFGLAEGKEFSYLTSVQIQQYFGHMRAHPLSAQATLLVCSLISRLVPEQDPEKELFFSLRELLEQANGGELSLEAVDAFFRHFLAISGFIYPNHEELPHKELHLALQHEFEQKIPDWSQIFSYTARS